MNEPTFSRSASLLRVVAAYGAVLVVGVGWLYLGPDTVYLWLDALIADLFATLVIFGFSRYYGNSSFYDAYWSVIPPLLALYWWSESSLGIGDLRAWLVLGVITLWAVRLTGNWVHTFPGLHHEDWRYPMLREEAGKAEALIDFFGIHLFPTLQVFLATVPAYVALTVTDRGIGIIDVIAVLVGVGAVALEFGADTQMHAFVRNRTPGQVMDTGLWAWSRHPNYFGEISFWLSVALFGLAASPGDFWWIFAGVAAMVAMFVGVSIPMMEKRSLERRPSYQDVIDRVPMLVPRPPRSTGRRKAPKASRGTGA